jgi:hypothetical protein
MNTNTNTLHYLTIIGNQRPFTKIPDFVLLQIFEFLNNGLFIIYYNKKTQCFDISINKHFPIITKALIYKQLHTPYYHNYLVGNKRRITVSFDPYGKGLVKDLIWYGNDKLIMFHQTETDSRRKALITRWNNKQIQRKKQLLLTQLTSSFSNNRPNYPLIPTAEYIKNTSFKKPILSTSIVLKFKHF